MKLRGNFIPLRGLSRGRKCQQTAFAPPFYFMAKKKSAAIAAPETENGLGVTFETIYFANVYGNEPQEEAIKDWSFIPPTHCGNRPWAFVGMSYAQAKAAAVEEIGERGAFGQFVVIP